MARIILIAVLLLPSFGLAGEREESCTIIQELDARQSILVVVCPSLTTLSPSDLAEIVDTILAANPGPPDEYFIDFYGSTSNFKSSDKIGRYYTHSGLLTLWPNQEAKKMEIVIHERTNAT